MTTAALTAAGGSGAMHLAAASDPRVMTAQGQLDAYNAQDLDRFMMFYADDCVIADLNGAITSKGAAAVRARYEAMFAKFPHNKAVLLNRIVVGNTVVDHEDVTRAPDGERFQACAIYTMHGGKIARVDFAK